MEHPIYQENTKTQLYYKTQSLIEKKKTKNTNEKNKYMTFRQNEKQT